MLKFKSYAGLLLFVVILTTSVAACMGRKPQKLNLADVNIEHVGDQIEVEGYLVAEGMAVHIVSRCERPNRTLYLSWAERPLLRNDVVLFPQLAIVPGVGWTGIYAHVTGTLQRDDASGQPILMVKELGALNKVDVIRDKDCKKAPLIRVFS